MKCSKCGAEVKAGKFCEECGAPLEEAKEKTVSAEDGKSGEAVASAEISKNDFSAEASGNDFPTENSDKTDGGINPEDPLYKLKKYEEGTITHPDDKPKKKRNVFCPQNPMLWAFIWLTVFGLVLVGLIFLFFNIDIGGSQIFFGISFGVFAAVVFSFSFIYYLPAALRLDKMLKGKNVRLEYSLKKYEVVDLAEKAKNRNRGFYLAIGLFGLAFTIYYIFIIANAVAVTTLMKISLIFSICVFVIFALLFFLMPKYNYARMMENGRRVIIGDKAVYYGGCFYHWRCINPMATFGNINSSIHELEVTFVQEFRQGKTKRRRVEMYAPDTALGGIKKLLSEYEVNRKQYQKKLDEISVLNEKKEKEKKQREIEKEKKAAAKKEKQLQKEKKKTEKKERELNK